MDNMTVQEALAELLEETKLAEAFINDYVPTSRYRKETERKIARNKLAIAALQAKVPRVLSKQEFTEAMPCAVWWETSTAFMREHGKSTLKLVILDHDYGNKPSTANGYFMERFWSYANGKAPTAEQMVNTPWNKEESE